MLCMILGKRCIKPRHWRKHRAFRNLDAVQKLEMLAKLEAQEKIIEKKEGKSVRYFMPVFFKSDCTTNVK